jgi:hypothetical protein
MASTTSDMEYHMQMIGTLEEYEILTGLDPATLTLEQQQYLRERIETIEVEARVRSDLPYELQRRVHQNVLRNAEPLDITRPGSRVTPVYSSDPHAERDYWRYRPFFYPTDLIHAFVGGRAAQREAHSFVTNVLLNPNHMARFHTLDPPKQVTFEILVCWDFLPDSLPDISNQNFEALFNLLHAFGGDRDRIELKLCFKDFRINNNTDPTTKIEIAPDNQGQLRFMKAKILDLLQAAMKASHDFFHAPDRIVATSLFATSMAVQQILNPTMSDDQKHALVRNWLAPACNVLIDHMWSMHGRKTGLFR